MKTDAYGNRHFISADEFLAHLRQGDEIEFMYRDERYWVVPSPLMLYKAQGNHYEFTFDTPQGLLDHKIYRSPLREIITWVDITHTLYP